MNKKIFLTSAVIMCMACPAMAENFPGDGNMLENKTYTEAAVYDNTGVYEGTATANAYYTTNNYNVSAGSYFTGLNNDNTATTATCTSGNYCPGVASTTYDDVNSAFVDDGLQSCPSGYASSDLGASANTQCYRTCDIANMGENGTIANIAHAASLSGHDYYGNGTDTCEPATCVAGWHKQSSTLKDIIGDTDGENSAAVSGSGSFREYNYDGQGTKGAAYYGLNTNNHNTWVADYGEKGFVYGEARCSTQAGSNGKYTNGVRDDNGDWSDTKMLSSLTDETGQEGANYCYCNVTGYKPKEGTLQSLSSSWAFHGARMNAEYPCAVYCAVDCAAGATLAASYMGEIPFRMALFSTVSAGPASCEANTINITWNDASAEDIAATGAATTVYEGDIKTPLKAVTKPGKTFVGWKFIKPQQ